MGWLTSLTGYAAPLFLIFSPVLSYSDQAYSMHKNKSSAGFSLDIPLILIVASMLRIFYYPGARFDQALLVQAVFMILVMAVLLKIALDNRPGPAHKGGEAALPFVGSQDGMRDARRPYNFWRWRSHKPYWQFILYLFITLTVLELLLSSVGPLYALYSPLVGYTGLAVEATLPLPQMMANARSRSCRGFRPSVIVSWITGDCMKMFWFFTSPTEIPAAFKVCGMFQAACDLFLGLQYVMYGDGGEQGKMSLAAAHNGGEATAIRGLGISNGVQMQPLGGGGASGRRASGMSTPTGRRTPPLLDRDYD